MRSWIIGLALAAAFTGPVMAQSDGATLGERLRTTYPSLTYVDRYRHAFPDEAQGTAPPWSQTSPLAFSTAGDLVRALVWLEDQHVALVGPRAGSSETLGLMVRTSTDGGMIVWRVFDPIGAAVKPGDLALSIDGVPTAAWLQREQAFTFGGNRRSRAAEAALNLGLGTRVLHQTQGVGETVSLVVQTGSAAPRTVTLSYQPMTEDRAAAMNAAINQRDLPRTFLAGKQRIGTMRLGSFAPQYDPAFSAAADAAARAPGTTDDQAMVAGFCAVVRNFITEFDTIADHSDVMLLDLRGNMGGFGREARLLAEAMTPSALPATFDVFASGKPGVLKLAKQLNDPSCGHVKGRKPILVLTDAGTRSAGELMAAWMWAGGAIVAGERTIGAGGGFELGARGFALPGVGFNVRTSGNFTFFDPTGALQAGETEEKKLVDLVSADGFAPSHGRPFAIQAAGLRPDLTSSSTLADLRDGGAAQVERIIAVLRARGALP